MKLTVILKFVYVMNFIVDVLIYKMRRMPKSLCNNFSTLSQCARK